MLANLLLLDIETVPEFSSFSHLDENWQQLWLQKIAKTVPESVSGEESYVQRAGVMAEFAKIICISTAFFYQDKGVWKLKIKSIYGHNEAEILTEFVTLCNRVMGIHKEFQFAGHNIKEFDIPFICRRLLINNFALPDYLQLSDKKPWETKMLDTLSWWKFGDYKHYTSLHLLANVLGIPTSKTDIDGSKVQQVYYEEKNLPKIVAYCERDVIVTANIILKFKQMPLLQAADIFIATQP
jgi:3'-5' exonuclease